MASWLLAEELSLLNSHNCVPIIDDLTSSLDSPVLCSTLRLPNISCFLIVFLSVLRPAQLTIFGIWMQGLIEFDSPEIKPEKASKVILTLQTFVTHQTPPNFKEPHLQGTKPAVTFSLACSAHREFIANFGRELSSSENANT
jgi:hypothetical protein